MRGAGAGFVVEARVSSVEKTVAAGADRIDVAVAAARVAVDHIARDNTKAARPRAVAAAVASAQVAEVDYSAEIQIR